MANKDNLMSPEELNARLTPEERKENASKAGQASVEARRKRKTLKEELLALLETNNYNEKISLSMITEALSGNTKAFIAIRDTIGEKPTDKLELNQDKPFEVNINIKKK